MEFGDDEARCLLFCRGGVAVRQFASLLGRLDFSLELGDSRLGDDLASLDHPLHFLADFDRGFGGGQFVEGGRVQIAHDARFVSELTSDTHEPPSSVLAHSEFSLEPRCEVPVSDPLLHRQKVTPDLDDVFRRTAKAEFDALGSQVMAMPMATG